jgi:hypothetical protein
MVIRKIRQLVQELLSYPGELLDRIANSFFDLLRRIRVGHQCDNSRGLSTAFSIVQPPHNGMPHHAPIILDAGSAEVIESPQAGLPFVGTFGVERVHGETIVIRGPRPPINDVILTVESPPLIVMSNNESAAGPGDENARIEAAVGLPKELVGDPVRQAVPSITGTVYQAWRSIEAWLRLTDVNEVVYVEGAEPSLFQSL